MANSSSRGAIHVAQNSLVRPISYERRGAPGWPDGPRRPKTITFPINWPLPSQQKKNNPLVSPPHPVAPPGTRRGGTCGGGAAHGRPSPLSFPLLQRCGVLDGSDFGLVIARWLRRRRPPRETLAASSRPLPAAAYLLFLSSSPSPSLSWGGSAAAGPDRASFPASRASMGPSAGRRETGRPWRDAPTHAGVEPPQLRCGRRPGLAAGSSRCALLCAPSLFSRCGFLWWAPQVLVGLGGAAVSTQHSQVFPFPLIL